MTKRILWVADTHVAHLSGLTHPDYWVSDKPRRFWRKVQERCWRFWVDSLAVIGKPDIIVLLGDLIDGTAHRNGGRELISASMKTQQEMAVKMLASIGKPRIGAIGAYGTGYHTGKEYDFEDAVAASIGAKLHNVAQFRVNGHLFQARHKTATTDNPCGGDIALRKQMVSAVQWAHENGGEIPDTIVRAHAHTWRTVGGAKMEGVSLPGLQAWTIYGGRECSGIVHYGVAWCDVTDNGETTWQKGLLPLSSLARKPTEF
jgi:hypothetical protein